MAKRIKLKTSSASEFAKAMAREADVLFPDYVRTSVALVVGYFYEGVVTGTPVLTGRARVNWFLTLSAPSNRAIDPDQKIDQPGYWFRVTGEPLTSAERAELERISTAILKGSTKKVFLSNNLDYIQLLEDGGSGKAPQGMVELSLDWVLGAGMRAKIAREAQKLL